METSMRIRYVQLAGMLALALGLTTCSGSTSNGSSAPPSTVAGATVGLASCPLPTFGPGEEYHPTIDPVTFSATVDNQYFPLTPGTTNVYTGVKDGKAALNIFDVTSRTVMIDGVVTRVVEDRLYLDNVLEERTSDYYAQDACRNVWYFGEDTATLDAKGKIVSTDGSFHAGVDGAQPGVFMQATPELGRRFRQEWSPGNAEDTYKVIKLDTKITVPAGRFTHALRTEETTALEPDVVDNKVYVKGIGEVIEKSVKGPAEELHLVEVIN
jgi:hypothetical protein